MKTEEETAIPAPPAERPKSVDTLIADYGNYVDIPELEFDDENFITIGVDDTIVVIEYKAGDSGSVIYSSLGPPKDDFVSEFFLLLSLMNHSSANDDTGIVTLCPETMELIWRQPLSLENLTVDTLDLALREAATNVAAWVEMVDELHRDSIAAAEESDGSSSAQSTSENLLKI